MRLRWTLRAAEDLKEIGRYISQDNPAAARRSVARLRARARKAATAPRAGRMVPEMMQEDIREVIEGNYRIVYRVREKCVDVLTVFEGHRLLREEELSDEEQ